MSNQKIKIALVDDHKILLDGIEALLIQKNELEIIAKAVSGNDLIQKINIEEIDIIIMDINMKDKDGIQVLKDITKQGFNGHCIFLSSYDDLKLVNEATEAGAKGYVTKASATEFLEEAIKIVQEGEIYYSPDVKERIFKAFAKSSKNQTNDNQEQGVLRQLTEREREVLKLIAQEYTSEEIAKKLYIAKSTVDTHRKNLIHKLKVKNAVGLGLFAERHGLI